MKIELIGTQSDRRAVRRALRDLGARTVVTVDGRRICVIDAGRLLLALGDL
jgi:hypothetical protein